MSSRSDVHRVGELVPANYKFVDILDLYAGTSKDDVAALVSDSVVPRRWTAFVERQQGKIKVYWRDAVGDRPSLSQCSICGAHIRYAVVWSYCPDGKFEGCITTGTDCAESMGSAQISEVAEKAGALKEFVAGMRRSVRADAERATAAAVEEATERWSDVDRIRRAWINERPLHRRVSDYLYETVTRHVRAGCDGPSSCFYCSLAEDLVTRGRLTERQTASMSRQLPLPYPRIAIPSGPGKRVIGRIVSQKSGRMLVKCDDFRVWMVPPVDFRRVATGSLIQFTADLTPSERDKTFVLAANVRDGEVLDQ